MDTDESKFYNRLRRPALDLGLLVNRVENEIESGWPDVLFRTDYGLHLWVELKVTTGPNARIKVRPEQINWAEEHHAHGGRVFLLAQNRYDLDQLWIVEPTELRSVAENGCLSCECYDRRFWPMIFMGWMGIYVNLQSANPTPPEKRTKLARSAKAGLGGRTVLPELLSSGDTNALRDRGPHHAPSKRRVICAF
jgi:hypothetical protein